MNLGKIKRTFGDQVKKWPPLVSRLRKLVHYISPETTILLDYPINPRPRWDDNNPHLELYEIIDQNRGIYQQHLSSFLKLNKYFLKIPKQQLGTHTSSPFWINRMMPALDSVALYSFIALNNPKHYFEIGAGISTKFARQAINDHKLHTKITSIDPNPRAEIDDICDEVIRKPVEDVNLDIFDQLENDDILYVDNSHRVFMNSDATTVFLDIIPRLKSGVLVEIHDVLLPYDYPSEWTTRYYSEQYLLAAYLLARGKRLDIVLPNMFISEDPELSRILEPLWKKVQMHNVETHGCSFWIKIK
jgi:hypothetical protein